MSATGLRPEASWTAKWSVSLVSLAALCLIFVFLVYTGKLFGSNYDVPPTWYWVLTVLLIAVDAIAMFYVTFKIVQVVLGVNVPSHLLRITVVILLALVAAHGTAVCSYSMIPQWDFQDSLFDDLSWRRGSGRISADCREAVNQSTSLKGNVSASAALYADRPSSYDEIQRIAQDWQRSDSDLENRTAAGWRGWIRDVSRHGHYSNPKHRLVTLFLQDPYSGGDATMFGQRPEAVLSYFDSTEVSKLTVGQEVVVCGRISDATLNADGGIRISISEPVVNPLPLPEALNTTEIPSDLLIEYEAHGCGEGYECPEYDVRIDSQGNVTYRGFENVPITGTQYSQVPSGKLQQLVFELQRTKLTLIRDLPENLEGNPRGATIMRVRMDGVNKSIVLPWRSVVWPSNVIMVIGKIEEVSNLQQWVKLVKSP